jgi:hypothetical protein
METIDQSVPIGPILTIPASVVVGLLSVTYVHKTCNGGGDDGDGDLMMMTEEQGE